MERGKKRKEKDRRKYKGQSICAELQKFQMFFNIC